MHSSQMDHGFFRSKEGWCAAAWTPQGLSALVLGRSTRKIAFRELSSTLPPMPEGFWEGKPTLVPNGIRSQVQKAFQGNPYQSPRLDLFFMTPFQRRILEATCQVPWGQTRSYAWVARKAGSPRAFRAAGQALNRNPVALLIPCHRVIAVNNDLGGYGGEIESKIRHLEREGVKVAPGPGGSYRVVNP